MLVSDPIANSALFQMAVVSLFFFLPSVFFFFFFLLCPNKNHFIAMTNVSNVSIFFYEGLSQLLSDDDALWQPSLALASASEFTNYGIVSKSGQVVYLPRCARGKGE
jgi:hypothetical protein